MSDQREADQGEGPEEEIVAPEIQNTSTWKYLRSRLGLGPLVIEVMNAPHQRFMNPLDYLGDILILLFVNQIVTGLLLMTHYNGSAMLPAGAAATALFPAYASTLGMTHHFWQAFVRDLHFWGANAMVIAIALHMARVFYLGAYKAPREYQWLTGVVLFLATIGLALTGYLLPWDQQSYWATQVATAMVKYVPVFGHQLLFFIRGCRYTCGSTLTLFFTMHVVLLPLTLLMTIGLHVFLVMVHGQVDVEARLPKGYREKHRMGQTSDFPEGYVPFWPNIVANMVLYSVAVLIILVIIAANIPAPLQAQASYINEGAAYYRPLPVWYFLSLYQILKLAHGAFEDRLFTLGLPILTLVLMVLLPFLDHNPSRRPKDRPLVMTVGAVFAIGILYFTYAGWKSEQVPAFKTNAVITNPSYKKDLLPIFEANCTPCHTTANLVGFHITSYQGLMKGGQFGPAVVPGNPNGSLIIEVLKGESNPKSVPQMPLGKTPLTSQEIQTISNWIKQGAKNN